MTGEYKAVTYACRYCGGKLGDPNLAKNFELWLDDGWEHLRKNHGIFRMKNSYINDHLRPKYLLALKLREEALQEAH